MFNQFNSLFKTNRLVCFSPIATPKPQPEAQPEAVDAGMEVSRTEAIKMGKKYIKRIEEQWKGFKDAANVSDAAVIPGTKANIPKLTKRDVMKGDMDALENKYGIYYSLHEGSINAIGNMLKLQARLNQTMHKLNSGQIAGYESALHESYGDFKEQDKLNDDPFYTNLSTNLEVSEIRNEMERDRKKKAKEVKKTPATLASLVNQYKEIAGLKTDENGEFVVKMPEDFDPDVDDPAKIVKATQKRLKAKRARIVAKLTRKARASLPRAGSYAKLDATTFIQRSKDGKDYMIVTQYREGGKSGDFVANYIATEKRPSGVITGTKMEGQPEVQSTTDLRQDNFILTPKDLVDRLGEKKEA